MIKKNFNIKWTCLFLLFSLIGAGASWAQTGSGKIHLLISVDWEGRVLSPRNLAAMATLRKNFPQLHLLHFLNAAYYTKPEAKSELVSRKIRSTLKEGDELGLHIHPWKSLIEAAGVSFRYGPTNWGNDLEASECALDCGHEVALNSYTEKELRQLISFSVHTLQLQGFENEFTSFRTGAWLGSPHVLSALSAEGFTVDSSAVTTHLLENELVGLPLMSWLNSLWAGIHETSGPYIVNTSHGPLWEVPDNGALADYVTTAEMMKVFRAGVMKFEKQGRAKDVWVQFGFHQETAAEYLPELVLGLDPNSRTGRE